MVILHLLASEALQAMTAAASDLGIGMEQVSGTPTVLLKRGVLWRRLALTGAMLTASTVLSIVCFYCR